MSVFVWEVINSREGECLGCCTCVLQGKCSSDEGVPGTAACWGCRSGCAGVLSVLTVLGIPSELSEAEGP